MDVKTSFPGGDKPEYVPENYDGKFRGPILVREALGNSINIPAVKMLSLTGIAETMGLGYDLGLSTLEPTRENLQRVGLSVALGGGEVRLLELAGAYSSFANTGFRIEPTAILKVTDSSGTTLEEWAHFAEATRAKKVITSEEAFIISSILSDPKAREITFGPRSAINIAGRTIAVKTGTTNDKRDNWTIGWTPNILVAAWVGNNDNSPMGNIASGVTGAAPIWRRIILEALKTLPNEDFEKPDNVIALTIDAYAGGAPVEGKPSRSEYFIKGTEPQGPSPIYQKIKVSKADNNKKASQSELDKNEYEIKNFIVFAENDPISTDGKNRWQEGINAWLDENYKNDDKTYRPPTETSDRVVSDTPTPTPTPTPTSIPTPTLILTPIQTP